MKEIKITLDGIRKNEYFQGFHQNARRIYLGLAAIMAAACIVILAVTGNLSLFAFLGPMLVFCAVLILLEIVIRRAYKDELIKMDPVNYILNADSWVIQRGSEKAEIKWNATMKLTFSKDCLFLYNTNTSSNMIPRRLISKEQEDQIRAWYQNSREAAKEYRKTQKQERRKKK